METGTILRRVLGPYRDPTAGTLDEATIEFMVELFVDLVAAREYVFYLRRGMAEVHKRLAWGEIRDIMVFGRSWPAQAGRPSPKTARLALIWGAHVNPCLSPASRHVLASERDVARDALLEALDWLREDARDRRRALGAECLTMLRVERDLACVAHGVMDGDYVGVGAVVDRTIRMVARCLADAMGVLGPGDLRRRLRRVAGAVTTDALDLALESVCAETAALAARPVLRLMAM